jgi:hypothetical protein
MKPAGVDQLVGDTSVLGEGGIDGWQGLPASLLPPFRLGPQYASADGWIRLSLSESSLWSSPLARTSWPESIAIPIQAQHPGCELS